MDRALIMIASIVVLVGVVGVFTVWPQSNGTEVGMSLTGNVVADTPRADENLNTPSGTAIFAERCRHCEGTYVCAAKGQQVKNYPSQCTALCDGAKVIYEDLCEKIPQLTK